MKEPASDFWVVCLVGSAGGLQAYIDILQNLPPDTGMASVFAPHRSLEQPELLPDSGPLNHNGRNSSRDRNAPRTGSRFCHAARNQDDAGWQYVLPPEGSATHRLARNDQRLLVFF